MEYIIKDEGWPDQFDLLLQKPNIDVPYLVDYAEKKGVGVILWCVARTLDDQMDEALDLFEKWGVKGKWKLISPFSGKVNIRPRYSWMA